MKTAEKIREYCKQRVIELEKKQGQELFDSIYDRIVKHVIEHPRDKNKSFVIKNDYCLQLLKDAGFEIKKGHFVSD